MIESLLFCWHPNGVDGFARLMIWRRLVIRDHSVINRFPKRPFQFCIWSICNLDALLLLCFGADFPNLVLYLLKLQNVFVEIANVFVEIANVFVEIAKCICWNCKYYFGGLQNLGPVERAKKQVFSVHLFRHITHKQKI